MTSNKSLLSRATSALVVVTAVLATALVGAVPAHAVGATHLAVSVLPTTVTAGGSVTVTVTAQTSLGATDATYAGTVQFRSSDGQARPPSDYQFLPTDRGVHAFPGVVLRTAGTQTVTATDRSDRTITGTSAGVTVDPGPTTQLLVRGIPSPVASGAASSVTVTAQDAFGNITPAYAGTVVFTSSDATSTRPAPYTFNGREGAHTFAGGVTLNLVGAQSLTATDTATPSITGNQSGIDVVPTLTVSGVRGGAAGTASDITVTAKNAFSTTVTTYTGTVHFTSTDTGALTVLPADYRFLSTDLGTHTFTGGVTLTTAGTQSVTATDTVKSPTAGTQSGIRVDPAARSAFAVTGYPSPTTAGVAHNVTVTAQDRYANTVTTYTGTVHITSSDAQATVPVDYRFVAGDNGVKALSVTLATAGTQSITATDTVSSSVTGAQTGIVVNPTTAASFTVTGYPSPTTAGVAHNATVTALDRFGNTATGYTGTVALTSSDLQAGLPAKGPRPVSTRVVS